MAVGSEVKAIAGCLLAIKKPVRANCATVTAGMNVKGDIDRLPCSEDGSYLSGLQCGRVYACCHLGVVNILLTWISCGGDGG